MGTPLDWKFFTLQKKSHFHFRGKLNKSSKKKLLKIGYMIAWTYVLLILQFFVPDHKSYGFRRILQIGVFVRRPEQSRSKSAEIGFNRVAKLKPILEVKFERPMSFIPQMISFYKQTHMADNQSKICFKKMIYWVAKLKPILENKFERPMSFKPQS